MIERLFLTGGAAALLSIPAIGAELSIGDEAPDLGDDVTWIQKGPIDEFEEGEIYVLDFWATWCGPCVATIPHMDSLADKHDDDGVTFIGIAIWPRDSMTPTEEFVAEKGEDMSYPIAADVNDETAKKFMRAIGRNSIPTVMIVDGDGRLAWIGHPMGGMDEALEQIMNGSFDLEAAIERDRTKEQRAAKIEQVRQRASAAQQSGDWEGLLTAMDELMELDPQQYAGLTLQKFQVMLLAMEDPERAYAFASKMLETEWSDESVLLNEFAWMVTTDAMIPKRDMELAMKAAERANGLTDGEDASVLDTLAAVHFEMGNVGEAVDLQKKAVTLASDPGMKRQLEGRLEQYESEQTQ